MYEIIDAITIISCCVLFALSAIWIVRNAAKDSPLSGYFMPAMGVVVSVLGLALLT